ncbi:MAG: alpha/beta hydrolase-fold protein [Chloroflexota bacterium]
MSKRQAATLLLFLLPALILGPGACRPSNPPSPAPTGSPPAPEATFTSLPPLPTLTPIPATPTASTCTDKSGEIVQAELEARMLTWPLRLNIYLPPCYRQDTAVRYPALYLLHGQNASEGQWLDLGVAETADRLIASGAVVPFIIVMPYDKSFKQPTEDRFGEALTDILIPYVDAAYRTQANRSGRALGGLSRGGAWAIHLGLTQPELFASIGAHAPAIFVTDTNKIGRWLAALPSDLRLRVFLDIGDNDTGAAEALRLESQLAQFGVEHEWHFYLGAHIEAYWRAHVEEYLRWYAAAWRLEGEK